VHNKDIKQETASFALGYEVALVVGSSVT